MSEPIRVLVADDHEIVREGIKQFIADELDMQVTGEAATGEEVMNLVRSEIFDILLLDISMPQKNGIDCLRAIKQLHPALPVLIVSGHPENLYALNLLRLGADGYFPKSAPPEELIKAIRTVVGGHRYLTHDAADQLATQLASPIEKQPHELLSAREYQIFHKLAAGESPTQIAKDLSLSVKTITTYRGRVLAKLQLHTDADLTHYSMKKGLLD